LTGGVVGLDETEPTRASGDRLSAFTDLRVFIMRPILEGRIKHCTASVCLSD